MAWLECSIDLLVAQVDATENALLELGAVSITLQDSADQPILEPGVNETPLWSATRLTALFEFDNPTDAELSGAQTVRIRSQLLEMLGIALPADSFTILADKDWEREWLTHFKPIQCGERLWICPGWQRPENTSSTNLLLDPGLAFGTGTHETTLMCLQWLDQTSVDDMRFIDFGCGSGILGIAALLLGGKHAVFVDNDPQAITATRDNLKKNHIEADRYTLLTAAEFHAQHAQHRFSCDIMLANILAKPLVDLAPTLSSCVTTNGRLVLSGILEEQVSVVSSAYNSDFEFIPSMLNNGWACLSAQRKSGNA